MVRPMAIIRFRCCVATETLMHVCTAVLLLCSYACRALFFFIIPCNESASGVLLARVTSFAGGYKSSAQNLVLCLRLDQRSVDWHPGHAFHVQQRLSQREREDSFEDVQNCTGVFFTAVHLPAVDNSFMLTGDLRSLMCRAVVDVKYLPCSQDSCPDALHQCMKRNNETMFLMCDPCHRQCISRSEENISSRNSLK